jgi:hypothetical protein
VLLISICCAVDENQSRVWLAHKCAPTTRDMALNKKTPFILLNSKYGAAGIT